MRAIAEVAAILDRGGKPTVRELLSSLVFNPADGTLRLNGDRLIMQRAAVGVELRRELLRLLGPEEARVFLIRLGFLCGQADARFVRTAWPGLDLGDQFTAGTRLHTFSGTVRVETVHNDFDFRRKRFSGEFLWHDSVEAAGFRQHHPAVSGPVCWSQVGYASGYASEFFDALIVYKEMSCCAEGHKACRVVGRPADMWGAGDADVATFRERIVGRAAGSSPAPRRAAPGRAPDARLSEIDRIILAPVREQLDRLAPTPLPVLVVGAPGTGRWRAAAYLHAAADAAGDLRRVAAAQLTAEVVAGLSCPGRAGGRARKAGTVVIDDVEDTPGPLQGQLAAALTDGVDGPRVVALSSWSPDRLGCDLGVRRDLWLALSAAPVLMPGLAARPDDRLPLAEALLRALGDGPGLGRATLDGEAARLMAQAPWPGNLPEMRAVLAAVLAARAGDGPIGAREVAAHMERLSGPTARDARGRATAEWLQVALDAGGLSMDALEQDVYAAAAARTGGNLSAAARLLGLTRAQLAYRMTAKGARPSRHA